MGKDTCVAEKDGEWNTEMLHFVRGAVVLSIIPFHLY